MRQWIGLGREHKYESFPCRSSFFINFRILHCSMGGETSAQKTSSQNGVSKYPVPLELSGALDRFRFEETTPVIGREYINVNIVKDLLEGEAADARLRDLAITSKPCCNIEDASLTERSCLLSTTGQS